MTANSSAPDDPTSEDAAPEPDRFSGDLPLEEPAAGLSGDLVTDVTQLYLNDVGQHALLTPAEELKFARATREGDFEARQIMIERNLRLVVSIARHYMHRGVALPDLIEEGNLGLMHAVEKFDPERGFRFTTYATWWIRQSIERAIMNQSRTIRLPAHVVKELNVVLRALRHLETHAPGGQDPSARGRRASARQAGRRRRAAARSPGAHAVLDAPIDRESGLTVADAIADDEARAPELLLHDSDRIVGGGVARRAQSPAYHRAQLRPQRLRRRPSDLASKIGVTRGVFGRSRPKRWRSFAQGGAPRYTKESLF
jgi:RNA polymerase nonessential primary-like sigma factor